MSEEVKEAKADAKAANARTKALRPFWKKKRFILSVLLVAIIVAVALGSGKKKTDSPSPTDPTIETTSPVANDPGGAETSASSTQTTFKPAAATTRDPKSLDVTVTGDCTASYGFAEQKITIVNNSSKTSNYVIQGVAENNGVKVGDLMASSNNVAAGQKALATMRGVVEGDGPFTCSVAQVSRYASTP